MIEVRKIIKVYDKNLQLVAYLKNAFNVSVAKRVNELWLASFSLPENDPENAKCVHFNFIEITGETGRNYGKYRIMPKETSKQAGTITYKCEHVLATLLDDVIDDYEQYVNMTTTEVLQAILNKQETTRWVLGRVDFTRYFQYKFENENGLLAPVLSIPQPLDEPYEFTFDTTVYPWVLNLIRPSDEVKAKLRWGRDMQSFDDVADPRDIVNYIIPKGYGEGVNQLTIESVNNGAKYLKDQASIDKWGKHSYIWIDRRFEDAASLMANAQSLLNQWKGPKFSFTTKAADLSVLPEYAHEKKILNGVTDVIVEDVTYQGRIIGETIPDITKEYDVYYVISNKLDDIATAQVDHERKIQVNEAYSQGATNIDSHEFADNADSDNPATIWFYIPEETVRVNNLKLYYETSEFRGYSKATKGGGATTATSTSGGGGTVTSASGGSTQTTTSTKIFSALQVSSNGPSSQTYSGHFHTVDIPPEHFDHDHSVSVPSHKHSVDIPSHQHNVSIPDHTHEIEYGIFLGPKASSVTIEVDGNEVAYTSTSGEDIDLVPYLSKDGSGKLIRGMHEITITPNKLSRITAQVVSQFFIQSRGQYKI